MPTGKKSRQRRSSAPSPSPPLPKAPQSSSPLPEASSQGPAFSIFYSEGALYWQYNCKDLDALASVVAEEAVAIAVHNVYKVLENVKPDQLDALSSFPTLIGGRPFTVKEWLDWGRQPYISIITKSSEGVGLVYQRDEARSKLEQAVETNEKLITEGLSYFGLKEEASSSEECGGCNKLKLRIMDLDHGHTALQENNKALHTLHEDNKALHTRLEDMEKVLATVVQKVETLDRKMTILLNEEDGSV